MTSAYGKPTKPMLAVESLPALAVDEMREVDRAMIEDFGISLPQMMENAGRHLAELALSLQEWQEPPRICVLAGGGNNGGGGLVCARHLVNRGAKVAFVLDRSPTKLGAAAARQVRTLSAMGIPLLERPPTSTDLIVDAPRRVRPVRAAGRRHGRLGRLGERCGGTNSVS